MQIQWTLYNWKTHGAENLFELQRGFGESFTRGIKNYLSEGDFESKNLQGAIESPPSMTFQFSHQQNK